MPFHIAEMSCLVCLAACTQSYVSSHAKAKVIIFIQFPTKLLCKYDKRSICNLNTLQIPSSLVKFEILLRSVGLVSFVLLLVFYAMKSPV